VNPNINYYVPLSSKKDKHKKMNNSSDFHKIIDLDTNELLSVINFNNMIPLANNTYKILDINNSVDKYLLLKEYRYCEVNKSTLINKAINLYKRFKSNKLSINEKERTVDFTLLEIKCKEWEESH